MPYHTTKEDIILEMEACFYSNLNSNFPNDNKLFYSLNNNSFLFNNIQLKKQNKLHIIRFIHTEKDKCYHYMGKKMIDFVLSSNTSINIIREDLKY